MRNKTALKQNMHNRYKKNKLSRKGAFGCCSVMNQAKKPRYYSLPNGFEGINNYQEDLSSNSLRAENLFESKVKDFKKDMFISDGEIDIRISELLGVTQPTEKKMMLEHSTFHGNNCNHDSTFVSQGYLTPMSDDGVLLRDADSSEKLSSTDNTSNLLFFKPVDQFSVPASPKSINPEGSSTTPDTCIMDPFISTIPVSDEHPKAKLCIPRHKFNIGDAVSVRWIDGVYYWGKIRQIFQERQICKVSCDDQWLYDIHFKDIHVEATETLCAVCWSNEISTDVFQDDSLITCQNCSNGFHFRCLGYSEDPEINRDAWRCRQCIQLLSQTSDAGSDVAEDYIRMTSRLAYNVDELHWNISSYEEGGKLNRRVNSEGVYCYCGGSGVWYRKMLQCWRCCHWFHQACVKSVHTPLLFGDRHYVFVCGVCNTHEGEFLYRLPFTWNDLVHVVLLHLSFELNRSEFDFHREVLSFVNDNWDLLISPGPLLSAVSKKKRATNCIDALQKVNSPYKIEYVKLLPENGFPISVPVSGKVLVSLSHRLTIPPPPLVLPTDGNLTDSIVMASITECKDYDFVVERLFSWYRRWKFLLLKDPTTIEGIPQKCDAKSSLDSHRQSEKGKKEARSRVSTSRRSSTGTGKGRYRRVIKEGSSEVGHACVEKKEFFTMADFLNACSSGFPVLVEKLRDLQPPLYTLLNNPFLNDFERGFLLESHLERLLVLDNMSLESDTFDEPSSSRVNHSLRESITVISSCLDFLGQGESLGTSSVLNRKRIGKKDKSLLGWSPTDLSRIGAASGTPLVAFRESGGQCSVLL